MNSRPNCQARVIGDEYHCYKCGLVWDINDLDPPECKTVFNVDHGNDTVEKTINAKEQLNKMRGILKHG